jgi:hypothetical protein
VKIKFSRHAQRRAKLYKIPEETIIDILDKLEVSEGQHEICESITELKYPLKIVFAVENETIIVITNYPVKKVVEQ